MRNVIAVSCLAALIVMTPGLARAQKPAKPYSVKTTGVGAAVVGAVGTCSNCFSISVEKDTDDSGVMTATMDLFLLGNDGTLVSFSGSIPPLLVTTPSKDSLSIFLRLGYDVPCISGPCFGAISVSFTKNKTYRYRREGSEHGVCANGVHIEDKFKQDIEGADVTGSIAGGPFASGGGQLSTFVGDPSIASQDGPAPCVLQ